MGCRSSLRRHLFCPAGFFRLLPPLPPARLLQTMKATGILALNYHPASAKPRSDQVNLPKQSRPVIRGVSRDPARAKVKGAQPTPVGDCLRWCAANCQRNYAGCEMRCHAGQGPSCP